MIGITAQAVLDRRRRCFVAVSETTALRDAWARAGGSYRPDRRESRLCARAARGANAAPLATDVFEGIARAAVAGQAYETVRENAAD